MGEGELPRCLFRHTAGREAGTMLRREVLVDREVTRVKERGVGGQGGNKG